MAVVPITKVGKLEFAEAHVDPWTTNAVAMGTTTAAVTDWSAKVTAARAAYDAQQAAQLVAKNATTDLNVALRALAGSTASIIKQVRAKALLSGNGIYALASLPVPATPTPVVTLGTPTDFTVALEGDGSLVLKWKCVSPRATGMTYEVWRALAGSSDFVYIGGSGNKKFTDPTVPAGSASVAYRVRAVRSTATGPWANFTVYFGTGAAGQATATIVQPRMAA